MKDVKKKFEKWIEYRKKYPKEGSMKLNLQSLLLLENFTGTRKYGRVLVPFQHCLYNI